MGYFDFVSERNLIIMVYVLQSIHLNLPALMFTYMREAVGRVKTCLPYNMVLTLIFREFGVPREGRLAEFLCIQIPTKSGHYIIWATASWKVDGFGGNLG